ncbi:TPA: gp58-like family protein [Streptococcus pyogenes]|uniref:gp58-like family protein n=1 Tax=Streptococcus canis TaxID=1329 RepID=UPI00294A7D2C|nr:gp58-like family protein [Streptococcus canis]MDV5994483.1 gp58-like family protein [Streptococcus canis]HER9683279.1 gp58-like family protein [Streptococcus pyogenes]
MSRDPTLILDESNLVIGQDGRVHYTFVAQNDNQKVRLASNCLGTAHFNQLMIERGDQATSYVAPVVVEGTGNPTGLFKDLKEISLELTDTENSNLWSKIKLTNRGMLQEYYDGKIKTEIVNSARGVATRISEETDKKLTLINDTIDGIRREYQDADRRLSASYQAGIEGLKATMRDDKLGLQAEIKASAIGIVRQFENQMTGLQSSVAQTSDKIVQEIRNRTGAVSQIQSTVDSYVRRLRDAEDNYSSLTQTVRGLQSTVSDPRNGIESRLTQLSDLISTKVTKGDVETTIAQSYDKIALAIRDKLPASKMTGSEIISAINLDRSGVKITGKNITLDGNSYISNAVIKDAHIANMDAGKINTGYLSGNRIAAEAITGDKIKMDYAFFNKLTANEGYFRTLFAKDIFTTSVQAVTVSASKITGGILAATNGASRWNLNTADIDFNSDATINFNSRNNALVRKDGTHTAFVHFSNATPKNYTGSALYASIGITSSGDGVNSASSGRFCGARFFRGASGYEHTAYVDQAEIYGDDIIFSDDFSLNRGFKMTPTKLNTMVDLNKLYSAVVALGRCWLHFNNVHWDPSNGAFGTAIINEYNNYISNI